MLSTQRLCPSSCSLCVGFMSDSFSSSVLLVRSFAPGGALDRAAGGLGDLVGGEPELVHHVLQRRRAAEGVHTHHCTLGSYPPAPAEGRGLLHGHPGADGRWQDLVAVGLVLAVEELPAGEAPHT